MGAGSVALQSLQPPVDQPGFHQLQCGHERPRERWDGHQITWELPEIPKACGKLIKIVKKALSLDLFGIQLKRYRREKMLSKVEQNVNI